jgi:hypothetical protein
MTEKAWQAVVLDLARLHGWQAYHTFDSRRSQPGFPDLVLWRRGELIFVELKTDKGRVTPDQLRVISGLEDAGQQVYVWRPDDLDFAQKVLSR